MVHEYLESKPSPDGLRFSAVDFASLNAATAESSAPASGRFRRFRSATSSASRTSRRATPTPPACRVEPLRAPQQPTRYTQDDLHVREFTKDTSRRLIRKGAVPRGWITHVAPIAEHLP